MSNNRNSSLIHALPVGVGLASDLEAHFGLILADVVDAVPVDAAGQLVPAGPGGVVLIVGGARWVPICIGSACAGAG